jgi:hypothetical protein
MRVNGLAKSRKFRDLNLPVSALYLLAAPGTPPEVRDEIIERVENGEKVPHSEVVERVRRAKPKKTYLTVPIVTKSHRIESVMYVAKDPADTEIAAHGVPTASGEPLRIVSTEPPPPSLIKPPADVRIANTVTNGTPKWTADLIGFAAFVVARTPERRSKHASISIAIAHEDIDEFDLLLGKAKAAIEKGRQS